MEINKTHTWFLCWSQSLCVFALCDVRIVVLNFILHKSLQCSVPRWLLIHCLCQILLVFLHFNNRLPGQCRLTGYPQVFLYLFQKRTFGYKWHRSFMGQMPFLSPSQQCLSTEGDSKLHPVRTTHWPNLFLIQCQTLGLVRIVLCLRGRM